MLHGWIKLHRALLDNWVASEPESLAVWVRLLSEANHKETKKRFNGSLVSIGRGQLVFGLNAFSDKSGVSVAKLRRIISELERDGMINRQKTSKYSLITITCFDKYQEDSSQITSKSQSDDNQITIKSQHRKNDKNDKNGKEALDWSATQMSDDEIKEVKNLRKNAKSPVTQRVIDQLAKQFELSRNRGYSNSDILNEWSVKGWRSYKDEWMKSQPTKKQVESKLNNYDHEAAKLAEIEAIRKQFQ